MSRFLSKDVIFYPSSKRDKQLYRESRVNTEHNMVNIVNRAVSNDFIIDGLEVKDTTNILGVGSASIGGYYFELKEGKTIIVDQGKKDKYLCLAIKLDPSKDGGELIAFDGQDTIDRQSNFYGIQLVWKDSIDNLVENTTVITRYLPLAKYLGTNKWDNLKSKQEVRLFGLKYDTKDITIKPKRDFGTSDYSEQSLQDFIEYNLVIDDGEVE